MACLPPKNDSRIWRLVFLCLGLQCSRGLQSTVPAAVTVQCPAVPACSLNYRVQAAVKTRVQQSSQGLLVENRHCRVNFIYTGKCINPLSIVQFLSLQTTSHPAWAVLSPAQKKPRHDQPELFKWQSIKLFTGFELNFIDFKLNNEYIQKRRSRNTNQGKCQVNASSL